MKKNKKKKYYCPHCQTPIKNWKNLYLGKRYICGNENCKEGFILVKLPIEIEMIDFTSF